MQCRIGCRCRAAREKTWRREWSGPTLRVFFFFFFLSGLVSRLEGLKKVCGDAGRRQDEGDGEEGWRMEVSLGETKMFVGASLKGVRKKKTWPKSGHNSLRP